MADLKPTFIDPDNPSQLREPRDGDTFINNPDLTVDTLSDLKGLDFETKHKRTETVSVLGNSSKRDGGEARYYLLKKSMATINNAGGYSVGSGITMTVNALPYDLYESDTIVFENGGEFVLTADASAGATSITGDLSVNSVVDGEKSNLKSDGFNIVTSTYTGYGGIGRWVRVPDRNKSVGNIDGLINDVQTNGLQDGESIQVNGYYSRGDGGGGTFYWDSSEDKANHNGGTIINPDHNSTIGSANWYSATGDGTSTTGSGCWKREYESVVNVKWFGAKANGTHNDFNAVNTCVTSLGSDISFYYGAESNIYAIESGEITLSSNQTHFSDGATIKRTVLDNENAIFFGDNINNISFKDIDLISNTDSNVGSFGTVAACVRVENTSGVYFKNVFASNGASGLQVYGTTNVRIDNCEFTENLATGISGVVDDIRIENSKIYKNGRDNNGLTHEIYLINSSNGVIENCYIGENRDNGGSGDNSLLITREFESTPTWTGFDSVENWLVKDNWFNDDLGPYFRSDGGGDPSKQYPNKNINFSDNLLTTNTNFIIREPQDCYVCNNDIKGGQIRVFGNSTVSYTLSATIKDNICQGVEVSMVSSQSITDASNNLLFKNNIIKNATNMFGRNTSFGGVMAFIGEENKQINCSNVFSDVADYENGNITIKNSNNLERLNSVSQSFIDGPTFTPDNSTTDEGLFYYRITGGTVTVNSPVLQKDGMEIEFMFRYNGGGTPSFSFSSDYKLTSETLTELGTTPSLSQFLFISFKYINNAWRQKSEARWSNA